MSNATDAWKPAQYNKFAAERRQPFDELVALCSPVPGGTIYDLGCGPGNFTVDLSTSLDAKLVIGQDNSPAMLESASTIEAPSAPAATLRFEHGELQNFGATEPANLIFSNAALHWVANHETVLARWREQLEPGGQIAVQLPCNHDHPAYQLSKDLAGEHASWFTGGPTPGTPPSNPSTSALAPETYAQILYDLGATEQHVALRVFAHELDHVTSVTEWIKGAALTVFQKAIDTEAHWQQYLSEYNERLVDLLGDNRPYLFTFKRTLMWARFE